MIEQRCTAHDAGTARIGPARGGAGGPTPGRAAGTAGTATDPGPRFHAGPDGRAQSGGRAGSRRRHAGSAAAAWEVLDAPGCGSTTAAPPRPNGFTPKGTSGFGPAAYGPGPGDVHGTGPRRTPAEPGRRGPTTARRRRGRRTGHRADRVVKFLCPEPRRGRMGAQGWRTIAGPPQSSPRGRVRTVGSARSGPPRASAEGPARVQPRADPSVWTAASVSSRRGRSLRPSRHRRRTSRGGRRNRGRRRPSLRR